MPRRTDENSTELALALMRVSNVLVKQLAPVFRNHRVTPQQWALLVTLSRFTAPPTLVALARSMTVTKQNVTSMVGRLEALGLLTRTGDPSDLRASRVSLTRRGNSLVEKTEPVFRARAEELLERVSPSSRKAFRETILELTAGE